MKKDLPHSLKDKRVTVVGLGRFGGGIAVSRWLVEQGAKVLVTDKDPADKLTNSIKQLDGLPIEFRLGEHRTSDFTSPDLLVISPAVPPTNEYLVAARAAGVPVTTEIRLFVERCPAPVVAVTGTKGKSTTTAMLGLMLKTKFTTWVGGNLGGSLIDSLPKMTPTDVVVLELSSYMLEHLSADRWSPHVAVVTMITRDHLEWHGGFEPYLDAKINIVRFMTPADTAILYDGPFLDSFAAAATTAGAHVVPYGRQFDPIALKLPGPHNQINAQGALLAAITMGVSRDAARASVAEFEGLPHRLQLVHESGGVRYVNDSIATIPEAAIAAMEAFPHGTVLQIVGGYDKHLDMTAMCAALAKSCRAVLTIGALGPVLASTTRASDGRLAEVVECGDLATALQHARRLSRPGDTVLLATGCASYDQFTNFESRGDAFAQLSRTPD